MGEEVRVGSGDKSIAVVVKDLLPIVVAVGAFAMMYVLTLNLSQGQERGFGGLKELIHISSTNRHELSEQMEKQNGLLARQTQELREAVNKNTETISERLDQLSHRLEIFSYNADRPPGERLPLDTPLPQREYR
jgi:hypothetical protein